jgi:hypothetical protein
MKAVVIIWSTLASLGLASSTLDGSPNFIIVIPPKPYPSNGTSTVVASETGSPKQEEEDDSNYEAPDFRKQCECPPASCPTQLMDAKSASLGS